MIHWSDKTNVRNRHQIGPFGKSSGGYARQAQTPVLTQTKQKFSMSMIAAVSNRGLMRFKLYEGALTGAICIDFMTRLDRDAKQKVILVVGDPRVHLAVQEWLAHHKDEIEIFTLPADAPEHTPAEARQDP